MFTHPRTIPSPAPDGTAVMWIAAVLDHASGATRYAYNRTSTTADIDAADGYDTMDMAQAVADALCATTIGDDATLLDAVRRYVTHYDDTHSTQRDRVAAITAAIRDMRRALADIDREAAPSRYQIVVAFNAPSRADAEAIRVDIHDLLMDAAQGYVGDPDRPLALTEPDGRYVGPLGHPSPARPLVLTPERLTPTEA